MSTTSLQQKTQEPGKDAQRPGRFRATKALSIDMGRVYQHLASLQAAVAHRDIVAARAGFSALRSILDQHMVWESAMLEDDPGWRPSCGRAGLEWSLNAWHNQLNNELHHMEMLVAGPSLAVPSAQLALGQSIRRLELLLASYKCESAEPYYRALDDRLLSLPDSDADRRRRNWEERMSGG